MTVALIEIGTRAVRLLVAASDGDGLRVIDSGVHDNPLNAHRFVADAEVPSAEQLEALADVVDRLLSSASRHAPTERVVFGTESLRRLGAAQLAVLARRFPDLRVLTSAEEARACHASACIVAKLGVVKNGTIIAGDIGSGSFELCAGDIATPGAVSWSLGTEFGSNRLRELYLDGGAAKVKSSVEAALSTNPYRASGEEPVLVFSGSAPTKLAWVLYKNSVGAANAPRYDIKKIQGMLISRAEVDLYSAELDDLRKRDRQLVTKYVSPENPGGPELEILLSGMQVMSCALRHVGCAQLLINGYGSRHGIAWLKLRGVEL